ncbi:MAG: hypothetical protein AAFX85_04700, partial [Pseudomonadota bacterium]
DDSTGQTFQRLANQPLWQHLRGLRLSDLEVDRGALATFLASPDRRRVESLTLHAIGKQTGAMRSLFLGARLDALTELRLLGLDLRKADVLALAELPMAPQLRVLDVSGNFLVASDIAHLLRPELFEGLETVVFGEAEVTAEELNAVTASLAHPSLRRLEFPHTAAAATLGHSAIDVESPAG